MLIVDAHCTYQAGLSVEQVAREGYGGLIVKATQGAGGGYTAPPAFDDWIRRARGAGMIPGAYHWLTNTGATAQVDHYLSRLDAVGGPEGLLCAVDVEDISPPPPWAVLAAWVAEWDRRTGGHPLLLYTGAWWWSARGWNGASLTPYLWASRYVAGSGYGSQLYQKVPDGWWTPGYGNWSGATLLQFTSSALVAGKAVDVSAFRGSTSELQALTRAGGTPMVDLLDPDPYKEGPDGRTRTIAAEIRDAYYAIIHGVAVDGKPEGVLGRLERIEQLLGNPQVTLTGEQLEILRGDLRAFLASTVRQELRPLLAQLGAAGDALGVLNDTLPPEGA
jgi:hypothetical protein